MGVAHDRKKQKGLHSTDEGQTNGPTVRQKMLFAAYLLGSRGEEIPVDDLAVECWHHFPENFGMIVKGISYPDTSLVRPKLSGEEGLADKGLEWLTRVSAGLYQITPLGFQVIEKLRAFFPLLPAVPQHLTLVPVLASAEPRLTSHDLSALHQLMRADALPKFLRGEVVTFADACMFWGFSTGSAANVVLQRIDVVMDLLKRAVGSFSSEQPDSRLPSLSTCYGLQSLNEWMRKQFSCEVMHLLVPVPTPQAAM